MLLVIGVIFVGSVSSDGINSWPSSLSIRHLIYVILSVIAFVVTLKVPLELVSRLHKFAIVCRNWSRCTWCCSQGSVSRKVGAEDGSISAFSRLQASEWVRLLILIYVAGFLAENRKKLETNFFSLFKLLSWVSFAIHFADARTGFWNGSNCGRHHHRNAIRSRRPLISFEVSFVH